MDKSKQEKWDERYLKPNQPPTAVAVLTQHQLLLPTQGSALDLACGLGGNALFMAQRGLKVSAWDISSVGLNKLQDLAKDRQLTLTTVHRDVEQQPPKPNSFDVICVSYFLHRDTTQSLIAALKPNGLLFYQTFTTANTNGPRNPRFVLQDGELLDLFSPLEIIDYQEKSPTISDGQAWLVGRKKHL